MVCLSKSLKYDKKYCGDVNYFSILSSFLAALSSHATDLDSKERSCKNGALLSLSLCFIFFSSSSYDMLQSDHKRNLKSKQFPSSKEHYFN